MACSTFSNGMRNGRAAKKRYVRLQRRDVADHHGDPGAACYKGINHLGGQPAAARAGRQPAAASGQQPDEHQRANCRGGGLGGHLGGMLGGRGAAPGAGNERRRRRAGWTAFRRARRTARGRRGRQHSQRRAWRPAQPVSAAHGQGDVANSWVSRGRTRTFRKRSGEVDRSEDLDVLSQHTGLPRDELLSGLSPRTAGAIDELTPDGRPRADRRRGLALGVR